MSKIVNFLKYIITIFRQFLSLSTTAILTSGKPFELKYLFEDDDFDDGWQIGMILSRRGRFHLRKGFREKSSFEKVLERSPLSKRFWREVLLRQGFGGQGRRKRGEYIV